MGCARRIHVRPVYACLLAVLLPAAATAEALPDFSGDYRMAGKGFGPNDTAYQGTCKLVAEEVGYAVSCYNADTRHTYTGKGLAVGTTLSIFIGDTLKGDHNDAFLGEYLVTYERQTDGSLIGTWLYAQGPAAGRETLTPMP